MRKTQLTLAGTAAVAVAAILAIAAPNQAAPAQQPQGANDHLLAVGVVNVNYVVKNMKEPKKLAEAVQAQNEQLNKEGAQRQQALQDLAKRRDDFKPGSAQYDQAIKAFEDEQVKDQVWLATMRAQLDRQQKKNMKQIFDHIQQASAEVAQQMHLNLVIADESAEIGPDLSRVPAQELQQALSARAVLYADKKADITQEVLTRVEADFANAGAAAAAGGK